MLKINSVDAICLFPEDFEASRKFYEEVFGFKPKRLQNNNTELTFNNPNFVTYQFNGTCLSLWKRSDVEEILGEHNVGSERKKRNYMIAIKLDNTKLVDDLHNALLNKGAKCICKPQKYHFGAYAMYYADNEGNIWEFYSWSQGNTGPSLI